MTDFVKLADLAHRTAVAQAEFKRLEKELRESLMKAKAEIDAYSATYTGPSKVSKAKSPGKSKVKASGVSQTKPGPGVQGQTNGIGAKLEQAFLGKKNLVSSDLQKRFGLSPTQMKKALQRLKDKGLAKPGKERGSWVGTK